MNKKICLSFNERSELYVYTRSFEKFRAQVVKQYFFEKICIDSSTYFRSNSIHLFW